MTMGEERVGENHERRMAFSHVMAFPMVEFDAVGKAWDWASHGSDWSWRRLKHSCTCSVHGQTHGNDSQQHDDF